MSDKEIYNKFVSLKNWVSLFTVSATLIHWNHFLCLLKTSPEKELYERNIRSKYMFYYY